MLQRQLGHLMINRIVESEFADFDPLAFFPETRPEDWAPHKGWLQGSERSAARIYAKDSQWSSAKGFSCN